MSYKLSLKCARDRNVHELKNTFNVFKEEKDYLN